MREEMPATLMDAVDGPVSGCAFVLLQSTSGSLATTPFDSALEPTFHDSVVFRENNNAGFVRRNPS
jgi:hypothetical protein